MLVELSKELIQDIVDNIQTVCCGCGCCCSEDNNHDYGKETLRKFQVAVARYTPRKKTGVFYGVRTVELDDGTIVCDRPFNYGWVPTVTELWDSSVPVCLKILSEGSPDDHTLKVQNSMGKWVYPVIKEITLQND